MTAAADQRQRRQYQDAPARFDYHLTEDGKTLLPVVLALMEWGNDHLVHEPRQLRHSCGSALKAVTICAGCGQEPHAEDVTAPWVHA